ncbi:MAG: hypothetical protein CVU39_22645 [Chloroflexi bacterium HGW-Chloroflexi-10]|nr:MAG: hypothetical protein CVU39_22645 [Chloroflexi bacterium HGW-Chloroflexi-10]
MDQDEYWNKLVHAYNSNDKRFSEYIVEFKLYNAQWLDYLRKKLLSNDCRVAFSFLRDLTKSELIQIFEVLIYYASYTHGLTKFFRDLIVDLPRDWVVENIEKYTHPLLKNEDAYRRVLELYYFLDSALTFKLAKLALINENPGIKEVGNDFVDILKDQKS